MSFGGVTDREQLVSEVGKKMHEGKRAQKRDILPEIYDIGNWKCMSNTYNGKDKKY